MRSLLAALALLCVPAAAQAQQYTLTQQIPATCNPDRTQCPRAQPVMNPDGSFVGVAVPSNSANAAITSVSTAAPTGGVVAKASGGNVYRVAITTAASGGYLMGFNSTTIPADGAVTPTMCRTIGANSTLSVNFVDIPARWPTGVTFVFSTTGCFTKTASATAFMEWSVL